MLQIFSVLSWNVREICANAKCAVIKEVISDANCQIVCIQEMKWTSRSIFKARKICNGSYAEVTFKNSNGASEGMLTAWKSHLSSKLCLPPSHTLTTVIRLPTNLQIMITNVYGLLTDHLRLEFFEELRLIRMLNDLPWLVRR
jgi:exonuclease III